MRQAAIYTRISDDREGSGLGVRRQLEDCQALAGREGWEVVAELSDNDLSAFSGKHRPGYERLCSLIEARSIDVVAAWSNDRLHRRPIELEGFIDLLERTGCTVVTVTSGVYDLSTPEGRAMARVGAAIASSESERKSLRARRKALELAEAGKVGGGGTRPFGFDDDRVTVRAEEATLIRDASHRVLAGEPTRSIVTDWNDRGSKTPTGRPWHPSAFTRMITSWRVAGVREHQGEPVAEAMWPAIVERETLERVRAVLLDPSRRTTTNSVRRYMLRGLLVCGRQGCGATLVSRPKSSWDGSGTKRAYLCARGPGFTGCGSLSSLAQPLEDEVVARVAHRLAGPGLRRAIRELEAADEGQDEAAGELVDLRGRLDELSRDYYESNALPRAEYLRRREGIDQRIRFLEGQLAASSELGPLSELPATEEGIVGAFAERDVAWCRAVLGAVLEEIELAPAVRGRNTFDPDRVSCRWRA